MKTYELARKFKKNYPATIAWRLKRHSKIIETHLNPGEKVTFAFAAQKNDTSLVFINTFVVALTNKRLLLGQKRLLFGYFFLSITPDLFNDLLVNSGLLWGKVIIDTVKEKVELSNISKKALPVIETQITEFMMKEKKKYGKPKNDL